MASQPAHPNLPANLSSYIPIAALTSPTFNAYTYANDLVKSVNTSQSTGQPTTDALVDLTTPLQKTLFDLQEIDTSIHSLTSRSALEILQHTQTQNETAQRILARVDEERTRLVTDFERLKTEVLGRYEAAEKARRGAERSLKVIRMMKGVQRVVGLARTFEGILGAAGEDHREMLRAAGVVLEFRDFMGRPGTEVVELGKVNVVRTIRGRVFEDGEAKVLDWARKVVREFSASSLVAANAPSTIVTMGAGAATYKEAEEAKARFTSAVHTLYLLSPAPRLDGGRRMRIDEFEAEYLLRALQGYLQSSVTSSAGGIGRGLGQLPLLERALLEVSARCQSVIALGVLLEGIQAPKHLLLESDTNRSRRKVVERDEEDLIDDLDSIDIEDEQDEVESDNLLTPLLTSLDTSSLTSYFWRSLASSLTIKVQEIVNRGGVSARTLKTNKDTVRAEIRDCVLRGSKMPSALMGQNQAPGTKEQVVGNWEREAAVMVGSVIGPLGR